MPPLLSSPCPIPNICLIDEKDQAKFEDLHRSIAACDDILSSVETNLTSFRNDLATVSADIESLQDRSTALNKRLDNRKEVEKALGPLVEELSVSPETISKIASGPIDESWAKMLSDVDRRAATHRKKAEDARSKAAQDLGPLLENLINKVSSATETFRSATKNTYANTCDRPLRGYATTLSPKSRHYDLRISTRRFSSSKTFSNSRTCSPFYTSTMPSWRKKSLLHT